MDPIFSIIIIAIILMGLFQKINTSKETEIPRESFIPLKREEKEKRGRRVQDKNMIVIYPPVEDPIINEAESVIDKVNPIVVPSITILKNNELQRIDLPPISIMNPMKMFQETLTQTDSVHYMDQSVQAQTSQDEKETQTHFDVPSINIIKAESDETIPSGMLDNKETQTDNPQLMRRNSSPPKLFGGDIPLDMPSQTDESIYDSRFERSEYVDSPSFDHSSHYQHPDEIREEANRCIDAPQFILNRATGSDPLRQNDQKEPVNRSERLRHSLRLSESIKLNLDSLDDLESQVSPMHSIGSPSHREEQDHSHHYDARSPRNNYSLVQDAVIEDYGARPTPQGLSARQVMDFDPPEELIQQSDVSIDSTRPRIPLDDIEDVN